MRHDIDQLIAELAAGQERRFSRQQALDVGARPGLIARRRASGAWVDLGHAVYGERGLPDTYLGDLWFAVLAVRGAVAVSHEAAARVHGYPGAPKRAVVVTRPHSGFTRIAGVTIHQITDSTPDWWTEVRGLPVTTPARTLVDGAATWHPSRLRLMLEHGLVTKMLALGDVASALGAVARRGKPGVGRLLRVLVTMGDGEVPPQSELERRLFDVLRWGGLDSPARQVPLPGREPVAGVVDAAYIPERLILEADGRRWHGRYQAMARDRERDAQAARAGWQTLRFVWEHLTTAESWVVATVAEVLEQRRGLLRAAS